jgi:TolB-like protein
MSVLVALASRAGEDVSRQDIIDAVWSGKHVSDDSLTQCIADIRKALGDDDRKILETVPRVGYRLVVPEKASGSKRLRAVPALLAALVAMIAGAVFLYWYGSPKTPVFPVVAILPMDDLSTADHAGYLGDALSEGIITELARFPQFKVIARNSSFQFRGRPTDIREIGEILGADYVVEGSQQYDGGNLRISIQLVETGSGTHVYSGKFDRRLDDLFDVQDEIVARVAATVGGSVMAHVPNRRSAGEVTAVLRGLQARKLMRNPTRENWRKALALEEASIREDPGSPWGYIGKSLMLVNGVFQGWLERPREAVFTEATDYAQKALDIAPDNYMSQYAMARVLTSRKEYPESILHFQRASELNPSDSMVLVAMSLPLLFTGDTERAISILRHAKSVDPLHGDWLLWQLGWAYWQNGECENGLDAMLGMSSPPAVSYTMLAALYVCTGRMEKAGTVMDEFLAGRPGYTIADEIRLNPPDWKPEGTLERWLSAMRRAGMPEESGDRQDN